MSKFPLYITFTKEFDVKSVGYAKPSEEILATIEEEVKWRYYGMFGSQKNLDNLEWFSDPWDKPYALPKFDSTVSFMSKSIEDLDEEIPAEPYMEILRNNILDVVKVMLEMHDQIGDVWKLPDMLDCFLYAQTEAAEFMESVLLQVRSQDSRNSKQVGDYDTAVEMFDVTMMLLRGLIAHESSYLERETAQERQTRIIDRFKTWFDVWQESMKGHMFSNVQDMYNYEPESLSSVVSVILVHTREYIDGDGFGDYSFDAILDYVFTVCQYVMLHPVMQHQNYVEVAETKLAKIFTKSILKKGLREIEKVAE